MHSQVERAKDLCGIIAQIS